MAQKRKTTAPIRRKKQEPITSFNLSIKLPTNDRYDFLNSKDKFLKLIERFDAWLTKYKYGHLDYSDEAWLEASAIGSRMKVGKKKTNWYHVPIQFKSKAIAKLNQLSKSLNITRKNLIDIEYFDSDDL